MIMKYMASVLFTIGGAVVNTLVFTGTNFLFSKVTNHGEKESKRHNLTLDRPQRTRDERNKDKAPCVYQ